MLEIQANSKHRENLGYRILGRENQELGPDFQGQHNLCEFKGNGALGPVLGGFYTLSEMASVFTVPGPDALGKLFSWVLQFLACFFPYV